MTLRDLALTLSEMYNNAPSGEQVTMIHLFGIKYADIIVKNGYSRKDIIKVSGLSNSYITELSKGLKLSKYVIIK